MDIYFLENSIPFNGEDLNNEKISGTEKILINISNELGKIQNINVKVFNKTTKKTIINNVSWININSCSEYKNPDILISFSDMNLFKFFKCKKISYGHIAFLI